MTDDNPNTEKRDDIVKLEFNFATGDAGRPFRAFIKEEEHRVKTDRSLADSMREGAVVELRTLGRRTTLGADYEFYQANKRAVIDFSKVVCAIRLSETEVKTDE